VTDATPEALRKRAPATDTKVMHHDPAPVVAAQALIAQGVDDHAIADYLCRTWPLDLVDANAAVVAAHTLSRRDHS
jgi:hypothetical protein